MKLTITRAAQKVNISKHVHKPEKRTLIVKNIHEHTYTLIKDIDLHHTVC